MKKTFLSLLFFVIVLCSFSKSENPLERLIAGFKKYLDELPQEKVFLHFDRPYYTTGETIWFKAYLIAGEFHQPSLLSHTIYVELIDQQGNLVKQLKFYCAKGSAAGSIDLPEFQPSGNYLVRAYTQWMKNGAEDYFFHRAIRIWNKEVKPGDIISERKSMDIQFFPEGGDLVDGIRSKIAVKIVNPDGSGRSIKGKIVDESGEVVCEFKSNHLGMGVFSIFPQKGKNYRAVIESQREVELPSIKESGLVMAVINPFDSDDLIVNIQTTDYSSFKTINILAQTRGIVCYAARAELATNFLTIKIPKTKFPDGIAQITITDSNGIPIAERLVFVNNGEQFNIEVFADKSIYKPREKVTLQIKALDNNNQPVAADLSMAVCDDRQILTNENKETIESYLLLSSELRGPIESPGYYFNTANEDREEALDNLLLTQGWRRFTFKKAMEPEWQKPEYNIEQGFSIKGKMVDKYNNKPIADGKVSYLPMGNLSEMKITRTTTTGDFELSNINYFGAAHAMIHGETKKGKYWIKFLLDTIDFQATHFPLQPLTETPTQIEKAFIARSVERKNINRAFDKTGIMLKEVELSASKYKPEENPSNYGKAAIWVNVSNNPVLSSMQHPLQILQGVPGVQVFGSGMDWTVLIRGIGSTKSSAPLIMVDNMPVDANSLGTIPVSSIESYMVWKGPDATIFGTRGGNGAIGFFTKKGAVISSPQEGIFSYENTGFQVEREFYNPKYDGEMTKHKKPDKRATLFWAPHIQTDSTGFATVSFYNHDIETTITGVIEGISTTGLSGASTFKYEIKKDLIYLIK